MVDRMGEHCPSLLAGRPDLERRAERATESGTDCVARRADPAADGNPDLVPFRPATLNSPPAGYNPDDVVMEGCLWQVSAAAELPLTALDSERSTATPARLGTTRVIRGGERGACLFVLLRRSKACLSGPARAGQPLPAGRKRGEPGLPGAAAAPTGAAAWLPDMQECCARTLTSKFLFVASFLCLRLSPPQLDGQSSVWRQRWSVLGTLAIDVYAAQSRPPLGSLAQKRWILYEGALALPMSEAMMQGMPPVPTGPTGFLLKLDVDRVVRLWLAAASCSA